MPKKHFAKIQKYLFLSLTFSFIQTTPLPAQADNIMHWQGGNVQLLRGNDFEIGEKQRSIVTFEYANDWLYGDTFMFLDWSLPDQGKNTYYTEISPRFSLSKIFDTNTSYGLLKDVLISTTLEKPNHQGPRYLYGGAVDLNIPGFKFFKTNAYLRDDTQLEGQTWQVTLAWNAPFELAGAKFLTEGFADFSGEEGTSKANDQIVPRLLLDAGDLLGAPDNKFFVGVEWHYWHNKFGIKGKTQSTPQLQAKWVF